MSSRRSLDDRGRWSVGVKFALATGFATLVVVGLSATLILGRLTDEAARQSEAAAHGVAGRIATSIQSAFDTALGVVDSTAGNLAAIKENGVADASVYDTLLKRMIDSGTDRYGAWFVWSPTHSPLAADKLKARSQAPYTTYWHQNGMEMLHDEVPSSILDSQLYLGPARTGDSVLLEPHLIDAVNGDPTLVTSFSRVLGEDGKDGVIAVDLKLEAISESLATIDLPPTASFLVVSDGGVIAVSSVKGWAGRRLDEADPGRVREFEAAKVQEGSAFVPDRTGGMELHRWTSIRFSGARKTWYLLLQVPRAKLLASAGSDRFFMFAILAASLTALLVSIFFAMDVIVARPLKTLSAIISGLGRGEFGFSVSGISRADEIGDIARAVDRLQDSGAEIARLHEANAEAEFRRFQQQRHERVCIADRFSQTIERLVSALQNVVATVDKQATEVGHKSDAVMGRLADVSGASAFAKESFGSVATAAMSVVASISSLDGQTKQSDEAVSRVRHRLATTDASVLELKQAISQIGDASQVVMAIASQINLIALNATIEAARAGEAGRTFAIVAQEVKALARQSAIAAEAIDDQIEAVQNAFEGAGDRVNDMHEAFTQMATLSTEIGNSLDNQSVATKQIGALVAGALLRADGVERNIEALTASSEEIQGAAGQMRSQSALLSERIDGLCAEVQGFLAFLKAA